MLCNKKNIIWELSEDEQLFKLSQQNLLAKEVQEISKFIY